MKALFCTSLSLILSFAGVASAQETRPAPAPPVSSEPPAVLERPAIVQPTPPVSPVPAPTPTEIARRRVAVRVNSTKPNAVLERRVSTKESTGAFVILPFKSTDNTWEAVCVTPCSVDLDRFSTYRVRAQNNITGSAPFTLPQRSDALLLDVKTGSLAAHRAGEIMSGAAIAALIVGGSLLITASDFRHPSDERIAGGISTGAGIALAAVGLPLALVSVTRVHAEGGEEVANRYFYKGHDVPFLPNINLGRGFTLTQRGIIF